MTLQEVQSLFGTDQGFFYAVLKNKTDMEILLDLDQTVFTMSSAQGSFIRVETEFTHNDYVRITE